MGWMDDRTRLSAERIEALYRRLQQVEATLANVRQQLIQAFQQGGGGGGGGAAGFFVAIPAAPVTGASWSGGVPTAGVLFTSHVYQCSYTGSAQIITDLGVQNCLNWLPAALVANQAIVVIPDGAGSYGTASQSCI